MKISSFILLIIFVSQTLHAQNRPKFELKIVKCTDCPAHKKAIDKIVKEGSDIVDVFNKIRPYFNPNISAGDAFTLKCNSCEVGLKYLRFPSRITTKSAPRPFVTKSNDLVFLSDLKEIFSGSMAIIDSAGLDLSTLRDKNSLEPFDIRAEYRYGSMLARRPFIYHRQKQTLYISQKNIFGDLSQAKIDTLHINVYYYDVRANKIKLNQSVFRPHFLNNEEQEDLKEYVRGLKSEFPEINEAGIVNQLTSLLKLTYNNVIKANILEWLSKSDL